MIKPKVITIVRIGEREFIVCIGGDVSTAVTHNEVIGLVDDELENLDYE